MLSRPPAPPRLRTGHCEGYPGPWNMYQLPLHTPVQSTHSACPLSPAPDLLCLVKATLPFGVQPSPPCLEEISRFLSLQLRLSHRPISPSPPSVPFPSSPSVLLPSFLPQQAKAPKELVLSLMYSQPVAQTRLLGALNKPSEAEGGTLSIKACHLPKVKIN